MYRRQPRSGRRSDDGLYQARIHRKIDHEDQRPPRTLAELYKRAKEAREHNSRHTFVAPEMLMHLIVVNESFLKLRRLVDQHWETAQKELGGGYSERDLWLWAQALGWHESQRE